MSELEEKGALEQWYWHGSNEPIRGQSPAPGAPFLYTVPGTVNQEIVAVSFTYTASAAAANRRPVIRFLDYGGEAFAEIGTPFTITATNVSRVTFAKNIVQFGANNSPRMGAAIPGMRLGDGLSFELTADAIAGADQISAVAFFVRQWPIRLEQ
jgi:hypothetical protein